MTWRALVTLGFAGLSAAAIALYWVQSRPVTWVVPYLGLVARRTSARPTRRWLRFIAHPFSLLAQLGLLLLLAVSLWQREALRESPRVSVWLVDVGVTMQALAARPAGRSRAVLAKERLRERIAELGEDEWVSIIEVGHKPELCVGRTRDKAELQRAVEALRSGEDRADFAAAVELAEVSSAGRPFEIVVFGDPPGGDFAKLAPSAISIRRDAELAEAPLPNLRIDAFGVRRYALGAGQFEAGLVVHSEAQVRVPVRATLYAVTLPSGAETPQDAAEFVVEAGGDARHTFARSGASSQALSCRVERLDGASESVPSDNVARAVLPDARSFKVLVVGEESLFLTAALLASADVRLERVSATEYPIRELTGEPRRFDLTIFLDVAPAGPAPPAALYLGSKGPGLPVQLGKELLNFGFDEADRGQKVFRFFDPYDTQVLRGHSLVVGPSDQAIAWTGKFPLVALGTRGESRFLVTGFSPDDSDMVLRSAFPLFVRGVLEELVEEDGPKWQMPARAGEEFELQVVGMSALSPLEIVGPLQDPRQESLAVWATGGRVAWTFERAGFYETRQDGLPSQYFAVNSAAPRRSGHGLDSRRLPPLSGPESGPKAWYVLALVAAALILVEYYSFHRKWTV